LPFQTQPEFITGVYVSLLPVFMPDQSAYRSTLRAQFEMQRGIYCLMDSTLPKKAIKMREAQEKEL